MSQDKQGTNIRISWAAGTSAPAATPIQNSAVVSPSTANSELHDPFADHTPVGEDLRTDQPTSYVLSKLKGLKYDPNLVLVNSGSVARDHLANERTVLAYVRTSLALASMGVALVQFLSVTEHNILVRRFARPLGAIGILLGLFTLVIGVARYFMAQKALTQGVFPVARASLFIVGLTLALLVSVIFSILVAVRR